jgi:coenzyme F420-reducing hydrogenase beta subunit
MTVLLLFAIALPFSAGTAFATTNITNGTSSQTNTSTTNNLVHMTQQNSTPTTNISETTNPQVNTTNNQVKTATANSSSKNIAAGSAQSTSTVTTTTQKTFTNAQITDAAALVQTFVQTNNRLPSYVTIVNTQVTMPEFLQYNQSCRNP